MFDVSYVTAPVADQSASADFWSAFPEDKAPATGKSDSDFWKSFPAEGSPSAVGDVAKSAGTGLAKGAIGLAGLPGDIRSALLSGVEGLHGLVVDHLGLPADRAKELKDNLHGAIDFSMNDAGASRVPTSAEIQKAVEAKTGDFRKPETTAGKYAETAASFVPATVLAPARSLGEAGLNLLRYGLAPGVASEAAGQATEGTAAEPYARIAAAVGTGAAAALASRPGTAANAIRNQMPDYVTPAHVDRAEALMTAAKGRGIDLTWPEALSKVTGRPVLTDMQRVLESAGDSRAIMQGALAGRPEQIKNAAQVEFNAVAPANSAPSTIGPEVAEAAGKTLTDVRKAINNKAEPFYSRAATERLTPQEMAPIMAHPGWAEASTAVRGDPQLNRYVANLPDNSVGFLNEVKKYLDQAATNADRQFAPSPNMQRAAGYGQDANAVRLAAGNKSTDYATALALEGHLREKYLDPLMNGPLGKLAQTPDTKNAINVVFSSNPLPGSEKEISTALSAVAKRNPEAARDLVRAHTEMVFNESIQNLQAGANDWGGAKFAARLVGNPQQRANLQASVEAVNGPKVWTGFEKFLDVLEATGKRQAIGSKTAFNTEDLKALGSGSLPAEAFKIGASPGKWWTLVNDKWARWQQGANLQDLARVVTDPRSAAVLKRIADLPTNSGQAQGLAMRLVAHGALAEKARNPGGEKGNAE